MKALTVLLSVVPGIEGLICGVFGVIEAIKSPYGGRGFECVKSVSSRPTLSRLTGLTVYGLSDGLSYWPFSIVYLLGHGLTQKDVGKNAAPSHAF